MPVTCFAIKIASREQFSAETGLSSQEKPLRLSRLAISALALAPVVLARPSLSQTPSIRPHPSAEPIAHPTSSASELPITRVSLYKNGVGFFEHSGRVLGDQAVTIDFTSAQLNDVLQSLTAIDLNGGRISGAGYNSTTPLDQQLKTLPLALTADPSDVDFYSAIRGARVQVSGAGISIAGRLLSIDLRTPAKKGDDADTTDHRFITVISDSGTVKTLELTSAISVTLLDTALHTDVTRYLELLASTRNQGLRHLTLLDRGTGSRDLRVSYISEVPVWKSTYRILFTDATQSTSPTVTLQGWSVVDNTTGSDWTNVHLDLIAGAPQSFIQPLSIPYYSRRPEIGLPSDAQLAPQTHDSGELANDPNQLQSQLSALAGPSVGPNGGQIYVDGFTGGRLPSAAPKPTTAAKAPARISAGVAMGNGRGVGSGNGALTGKSLDALSNDPDTLASEYQSLAQASLVPQTRTAAFDDFFEYTLTDPITIRKNESALVPILQTKLPVERVTLWSAAQPVALRALWITNSSNLTLDRGSFSIVENGSFGGEGLLDAIHPGEKRLLSYAADQAVRVDNKQGPQQHHLRSVVISRGIMVEHYRDVVDRDYSIRNAAPEARTVIIEHTRTANATWNLHSDTALDGKEIKPDETLPNAYRFRVVVTGGATVHLKVAEAHAYVRNIQIGGINDQQIKILIGDMGKSAGDDPALLKQLQPVLDAQRAIADIEAKRNSAAQHLNQLSDEERRQRDNITALKDADKLAQKRFVDELGRIEDQILDLQKQQQALDTQLEAARADLNAKVQAVQFNQTLEP